MSPEELDDLRLAHPGAAAHLHHPTRKARPVKTLRTTLAAIGTALALALGACQTAPAAAASCHPDGSRFLCGRVLVSKDTSKGCSVITYGGWTAKGKGGVGTHPATLFAGGDSRTYHRDSDGVKTSSSCRWTWTVTGDPFPGGLQKNALGTTWRLTGRK